MLARITDQARYALERAERCRHIHRLAGDPQTRREYEKLEQGWLRLAESFQFAEQISGYLEWQSKRLEPPAGVDLWGIGNESY
jgi:hypothetical protein